ncbi:DUF1566 domain-containing protein [candidate division KSB1 bacterium]|nr:DUF1566 domain-containing protein [candidate division KSB1 bacterium]RQW04782.1 MAG: DUF1566 domain-containing protein [candidate division KSB1 bacterium]
MAPDSTLVTVASSSVADWVKVTGSIIAILSGLTSIAVVFFTRFLPWCRDFRKKRSLEKHLSGALYPVGILEQATRNYIEPFCQSIDPSGGEDAKLVYSTKENIFQAMDNNLYHPTEYRYLILLADSGMGKTSFLLNYYVRNIRRLRNKLDIVLLPLGIPDVDERIQKIKNQQKKVLFLDALDEDTLAIVDHKERLRQLIKLTKEFKKIVITCRTQFFPKDEEIPGPTGIVRVHPLRAGQKAEYVFHKIYLSPFNDKQVSHYLRRHYPVWQFRQRKRACELVQKMPDLKIRPMLLAHIKDLVAAERDFYYSFQIYEEMIEAWLLREEGRVEGLNKEPLRQFCERLAVDIYLNRQERKSERVARSLITELIQQFGIKVDDWQLTGRSLLNRDALGNYKFAHRSIMEYLYVLQLLKMPSAQRPTLPLTDQMNIFLADMLRFSFETDHSMPDLAGLDLAAVYDVTSKPILQLRSQSMTLDSNNVSAMLKKYNFYDRDRNKSGTGNPHVYRVEEKDGQAIVHDAITGLMWQKGGSSKTMIYKDAKKWLREINRNGYAGYHDWHLPTLEEAMSLMEPKQKNGDLYIDPAFDAKQRYIWTCDPVQDEPWFWVVSFYDGDCGHLYSFNSVRAVRSRPSSG